MYFSIPSKTRIALAAIVSLPATTFVQAKEYYQTWVPICAAQNSDAEILSCFKKMVQEGQIKPISAPQPETEEQR